MNEREQFLDELFFMVDVKWHFMVISRLWTGMPISRELCFFLYSKVLFGKSFLGLGWEMKWYFTLFIGTKENGTPKADVQISLLSQHCPKGQLQNREHGKQSIHFAATQEIIKTTSRIFVSANQLSLYGAVAEMCKEYETLPDRSGRLDWVMGQSLCSMRSKQKFLWTMTTQHTLISYCNNLKNELQGFHKKTKWVNSVGNRIWEWTIPWWKTLEIWHNSTQWLVVNTLFRAYGRQVKTKSFVSVQKLNFKLRHQS